MKKEEGKSKPRGEAPTREAKPGTTAQAKSVERTQSGGLAVTESMEDTCSSQQYTIIKELGKGSYGAVYLCKGKATYSNSKLALKVIDTQRADKQYVTKFLQRECAILLRIKHAFIIHVHSMVRRNKKIYIFMRYAEQGDLLELIAKEGRQPEPRAKLWSGQVAVAMQYLHSKNIAHRDIKCENILITSHGNTKLSDFGFSTIYTIKNGRPVLCSTFCGTRHYASPEILSSTPYDPEKSDVWAFGVVLYVILNASVPFPSNNPKQILEYQRKGSVRMKSGVKVAEEALLIFQNVFELNQQKRWGSSQLLTAEWFRTGPVGRKPGRGIREKPHNFEQPGSEESARGLHSLMGGEAPVVFPPIPSSHISGAEQIPSFMTSGISGDQPTTSGGKEKAEDTRKGKRKF